MRTFSIRLDDELFQKLESVRGENSRADYIREVLVSHFKEPDANLGEPQANLTKEIESLESELQSKESELQSKNSLLLMCSERVKDLQKDMGFLQLEYQKLTDRLMLPAPKPWWHFWKK